MNNFFKNNYQLIHQEWLSPADIPGKTILDLGCQTNLFGDYCKSHGAKQYIGVDIDQYWVETSRNASPDLEFVHMDLEEYVDICLKENKTFDIIIISRTFEGVHNQVSVLQKLSKICTCIIIEGGCSVNWPAYKLLEISESFPLNEEQVGQINAIKHQIVFEQAFVDYVDDRFIWAIPSIGFYNTILSKLGFTLNIDTYLRVREKFPQEYGYFIHEHLSDGNAMPKIGKAILKFYQTRKEQYPLTWKEWYDTGER
jgi:predicted RNA methylase